MATRSPENKSAVAESAAVSVQSRTAEHYGTHTISPFVHVMRMTDSEHVCDAAVDVAAVALL